MHDYKLQRCTIYAKILQESGNVTANLKTVESCYKYVRLCYDSAAAIVLLLYTYDRRYFAAVVILQPLLCCSYRLTIAATFAAAVNLRCCDYALDRLTVAVTMK